VSTEPNPNPNPNPYEQLDPVPVTPPRDAVLELRDRLRDQFGRLGVDARIVTTEGTRRSIVIGSLPLGDARRLVAALESAR
jgi:hypothetical protein